MLLAPPRPPKACQGVGGGGGVGRGLTFAPSIMKEVLAATRLFYYPKPALICVSSPGNSGVCQIYVAGAMHQLRTRHYFVFALTNETRLVCVLLMLPLLVDSDGLHFFLTLVDCVHWPQKLNYY